MTGDNGTTEWTGRTVSAAEGMARASDTVMQPLEASARLPWSPAALLKMADGLIRELHRIDNKVERIAESLEMYRADRRREAEKAAVVEDRRAIIPPKVIRETYAMQAVLIDGLTCRDVGKQLKVDQAVVGRMVRTALCDRSIEIDTDDPLVQWWRRHRNDHPEKARILSILLREPRVTLEEAQAAHRPREQWRAMDLYHARHGAADRPIGQ